MEGGGGGEGVRDKNLVRRKSTGEMIFHDGADEQILGW